MDFKGNRKQVLETFFPSGNCATSFILEKDSSCCCMENRQKEEARRTTGRTECHGREGDGLDESWEKWKNSNGSLEGELCNK